MMGNCHEDKRGNSASGGNFGQAGKRHGSGGLPPVQRGAAKQDGLVPVGDVHAGRRCLALLALRS